MLFTWFAKDIANPHYVSDHDAIRLRRHPTESESSHNRYKPIRNWFQYSFTACTLLSVSQFMARFSIIWIRVPRWITTTIRVESSVHTATRFIACNSNHYDGFYTKDQILSFAIGSRSNPGIASIRPIRSIPRGRSMISLSVSVRFGFGFRFEKSMQILRSILGSLGYLNLKHARWEFGGVCFFVLVLLGGRASLVHSGPVWPLSHSTTKSPQLYLSPEHVSSSSSLVTEGSMALIWYRSEQTYVN